MDLDHYFAFKSRFNENIFSVPEVASIFSATFACVPSFRCRYSATKEMLFPHLVEERGSREVIGLAKSHIDTKPEL